MENKIKLSVKRLVDFILRSGDIGGRSNGNDSVRMQEGSRIHRMLQHENGENYKPEVYLQLESCIEDTAFTVEGRADGVLITENGITIDEIKSTTIPLEFIDEDYNITHWAQGMCYAYIYIVKNELVSISVRLTYYNVDTDKILRYIRLFTQAELAEFYFDLLIKYKKWANFLQKWSGERNNSIKNLKFPFKYYRIGQHEFALSVYKTIKNKGKLFAQAPTGIGKTMSSLYPAVKSIFEGFTEKIFYLTAKTITRLAAEEAVLNMRISGLKVKTITLTAKDKICFLNIRKCNPDNCIYANGHFNRINEAIYDILVNHDNYTREIIEEYSKKYTICPYELSLDLTLWADIIICDYNYLFDPMVYLRRFFEKSDIENNYVFLIDEAHNLVDRAREMYSATIYKSSFYHLKRVLRKDDKILYDIVNKINFYMLRMKKLCGDDGFYLNKQPFDDLPKLLAHFMTCCDEWLKINYGTELDAEISELYLVALNFVKIMDFYDKRYVTYVEPTENNEVYCKLFCLDPSYLLSQCMKKGRASILFSATLTPTDYFISVLGGDQTSKKLNLESPFDKSNMCLIVADKISTKFNDRDASMISITDMIYITITGKTGNYIVYFPSYKYMNSMYEIFHAKYPQIVAVLQKPNMNEVERENFLGKFDKDNSQSLIGFCVLGGIYSEGIDLKGERLIGCIIIGVGLPQINSELNIIRDYFSEKYEIGYEYAYVYPGMNKVLQAAGRVIRGENERGVILLIDDRLSSVNYKQLFPTHWNHLKYIGSPNALQSVINKFWAL